MDWDTLLMHCTPVQEVKKGTKRVENEKSVQHRTAIIGDVKTSHLHNTSDEAGHKRPENLKFWRVFAALVHSVHTNIFWRLRVATFIYTLHYSAPQALVKRGPVAQLIWQKAVAEGLHLHLQVFRGTSQNANWNDTFRFVRSEIRQTHQLILGEYAQKKNYDRFFWIHSRCLLRSSKNHQQHQAFCSFFHRQCQRRSKVGSAEIPAANFLGAPLLCRYISHPKLTFQLLQINQSQLAWKELEHLKNSRSLWR